MGPIMEWPCHLLVAPENNELRLGWPGDAAGGHTDDPCSNPLERRFILTGVYFRKMKSGSGVF